MTPAPRIIASFILFSLLGACGLKGPLYLPPPEPDENQTPAQPVKAGADSKASVLPRQQPANTPAAKDAPEQAPPSKPQTPSSDTPALDAPPADK